VAASIPGSAQVIDNGLLIRHDASDEFLDGHPLRISLPRRPRDSTVHVCLENGGCRRQAGRVIECKPKFQPINGKPRLFAYFASNGSVRAFPWPRKSAWKPKTQRVATLDCEDAPISSDDRCGPMEATKNGCMSVSAICQACQETVYALQGSSHPGALVSLISATNTR
jgi:hypothetical protein